MANDHDFCDLVIRGLLGGVAGRCKEGNASLQKKIEGAEASASGACYCDVSMLDMPRFCEYQGEAFSMSGKMYFKCGCNKDGKEQAKQVR